MGRAGAAYGGGQVSDRGCRQGKGRIAASALIDRHQVNTVELPDIIQTPIPQAGDVKSIMTLPWWCRALGLGRLAYWELRHGYILGLRKSRQTSGSNDTTITGYLPQSPPGILT